MSFLQVKAALLKRGYIQITYGGGITGDQQVNDTHLHKLVKDAYR